MGGGEPWTLDRLWLGMAEAEGQITRAGSGGQSMSSPVIFTPLHSKNSNNEVVTRDFTAAFAYVFKNYQKLSATEDLPGPANPSWIFGLSPPPFTSQRSIALNVRMSIRTPVGSPG